MLNFHYPFCLSFTLSVCQSGTHDTQTSRLCTQSNTVGGDTHHGSLQTANTERRKRRNHLRHQLGDICWCSLQLSASLRQCRTHPWTVSPTSPCCLFFHFGDANNNYLASVRTSTCTVCSRVCFGLNVKVECDTQQPPSLSGPVPGSVG